MLILILSTWTKMSITHPVTMRVDGDGLFETSQTSSRPSHIVTLNNWWRENSPFLHLSYRERTCFRYHF